MAETRVRGNKGLALLAAALLGGCATKPPAAPHPAGVVPPLPVAPVTPTEILADSRPYALPGTQVHRIDSPGLGRAYELYVSLPPGYAADPGRRYPVLYVTDAAYAFPVVRAIASRIRNGGRDVEDFILVGLSYAVGETGQYSRRRDYTPSPNGDLDAVSDMPGRPVVYGEAEAYRQHIRDEVFPFIDSRFRTDPSRRLYAGHSYGGLFGTHVLLTEPQMFQRYILMSPSLWYDRKLMLFREGLYAGANRDMKADVFLGIGALETSDTPDIESFAAARHDMTGDMARFEYQLRARRYPSLRLRSVVLPEEDHMSVYPALVTRGLRWALAPGA